MYNSFRQSGSDAGPGQSGLGQAEDAARGLLQMLNKDELEQLHNDDGKLTELINDLPQVKALGQDKVNLMMRNKSAADHNLSRQPRLDEARSQLARVYEQGVTAQKSYEANKDRLSGASTAESLDTVLALLQTESAKAEEDSEELMERFYACEVEPETFIEEHIKTRTLAHLRKVKVEKLEEILRGQRRGSQPALNHSGSGGRLSAPYPMHGGMPDHAAYLPR